MFSQTQNERHENTNLRAENERLRAENVRFREALSNTACPNCGGPTAIGEISYDEHHVRLENAHLREEVLLINTIKTILILLRALTIFVLVFFFITFWLNFYFRLIGFHL